MHLSPSTNLTVAATLPALIDRASAALANARTSAEVLEAREIAGAAFDVARRTARLLKARQAHDEVTGAAEAAMGDLLVIEKQAKMRLADEYDAAQERGEVAGPCDGQRIAVPDGNGKAIVADLGLTRKDIHEARQIRDAERIDPGIVRRTVDARLAAGQEPTKASIRHAVRDALAPSRSAWSADDIAPPSPVSVRVDADRLTPKPTPYITGSTAVMHVVIDTLKAIKPLGDARAAMQEFSPQLAHAVSVADLQCLSDWFAAAAEEWRRIREVADVEAA